MDIDAEMADTNTQEASTTTARNPNEVSSGTLDHEFTQSETQPATATATTSSGLPHHNRKDVSLREFLSKMDDYAPIVSVTLFSVPLPAKKTCTWLTHSRL